MKKILKSLLLLAAVTTGTMSVVSCSDDDDLPAADALFRPVITESGNIEHFLDDNMVPYMTIKWDNYTDANQYVVRVEATDGSDVQEITTDSTACEFNNLEYDKEYTVYLTAVNTKTGLSSKPFSLVTTTMDYPTQLSSVGSTDLIDVAARISWSGINYDSLQIWKDSNDSLVTTIVLTDADNAQKSVTVNNLEAKTTYRVLAFVNDKYLGKKRFSTAAAENYGDDVVIDLRGLSADESKKYINTTQIAADVEANPGKDITYVLQGGTQYTISDLKFPTNPNRIKFVTGMTLAGNAEFISSSAMTAVAGSEIGALEFEKINFYAGKGLDDVKANPDFKFGSKQVFNLAAGVNTTVGSISFKSCSFQLYRGMIRTQSDSASPDQFIGTVTFDDCVINGVGDQGVITTSGKKAGDFKEVSFLNCTITNVNYMADLRKTASNTKFSIESCTVCYAPKSNFFRVKDSAHKMDVSIKKSLFGPSASAPYTAGTASPFIDDLASLNSINIEDSYKTNFEFSVPDNAPEGLKDLGLSETELWESPAEGDFTVIGKSTETDLKTLGDQRWN